MVADQLVALRVVEVHGHLRRFGDLFGRDFRVGGEGFVRGDQGGRLVERLAAAPHDDAGVGPDAGHVGGQMQPSVGADLHVDRRVFVAPVDVFQVADAVPVGRELLRLVGIEPAVVGLVVRVGAHHQLAVVAVVVGQDAGVPLRVGAPEPEFAALDDVVVARQHRAGLAAGVVPGDEVLLEVVHEHRVGHEVVLPPRGVNAVGVFVDAVERLAGDGPVREPVLAVEGHEFGALGEDDLVVVVHERRDVRPVEHRIVVLGRVDQPSGDLHVGFARTERDADGPRHAVAEFGLADPDGLAAVPVLDDAVVARDVRRGAVVVEDVPFDAPRNPRSRHADVRRLDHVLVVEDVVAVGLVDGVEQPSADLRQDAQFDVFVFEVEGLVAHRLFVARHVVVERIGVDRAARPLVGPVAFEDGPFRLR